MKVGGFQHGEIFTDDVLHVPAATIPALDEDAILPAGHDAIVDFHIAHTAGTSRCPGRWRRRRWNFADGQSRMDDVLGRTVSDFLRGQPASGLEVRWHRHRC